MLRVIVKVIKPILKPCPELTMKTLVMTVLKANPNALVTLAVLTMRQIVTCEIWEKIIHYAIDMFPETRNYLGDVNKLFRKIVDSTALPK